MSNSNKTSAETKLLSPVVTGTPAPVRFWLYLISDTLSILCSLSVLCFILFDRTLHRALNNHIIILLLIIGLINELTGIPCFLHYLHSGVSLIETSTFYLVYFFFDYGIYTTQIILFAWATIERHILIFHDRWVSTRKKRIFVHYLPIIAILIYCLIYYSLIAFGPFCENSFDVFITGGIFIPCLYSTTILGVWDLLIHQIIPTLIIVISSITLIVRVLRQKRRINQSIQWRKHRKMTIQLLSISALYLVFNSPWTILIFMLRYGIVENGANLPLIYTVCLRAYIIFLFPFVCCGSLPELRSKFKKIFLHRRQRQQMVPLMPLKIIPRLNAPTADTNHLSNRHNISKSIKVENV